MKVMDEADVIAALHLDDQDRATLRLIEDGLHHDGSPPSVTVVREIGIWRTLAAGVNDDRFAHDGGGDRPFIVDDYLIELSARDVLARVLNRCPQPLWDRLNRVVTQIDEVFYANTKPDTNGMITAYMNSIPDDHWWWWRMPHRGPVYDAFHPRRDG